MIQTVDDGTKIFLMILIIHIKYKNKKKMIQKYEFVKKYIV